MSGVKTRSCSSKQFVPDIKSTNNKTKVTQLRQSSQLTTIVISTSCKNEDYLQSDVERSSEHSSVIKNSEHILPVNRNPTIPFNFGLTLGEPVNLNCSYPGCEQKFTDGHQFNLHIREHNGEKVYKCEWIECGRLFSNRQRLNDHIRFIHTKERPYKCTDCEKAFSSSKNLRAHRLLHTGERPHKCKYCGSRFRRNHHLTAHVRIHTGERPYPCQYPGCGLAFTKSDHSKRHYMTHFKTKKTRTVKSSTIPMRKKTDKTVETSKSESPPELPFPSLPDEFGDNFEINPDDAPDLLSPMVLLDEKEGILIQVNSHLD